MERLILISMPGGTELLLLMLVVLILFGARRIPEVAQNLGKGIREFKKSIKEVQSEVDAAESPKGRIEKSREEEKNRIENKNE
jgi:TatA/E family protein of Tat protein translocase